MIFERGHFKSTTLSKAIITESLNESRKFSAHKKENVTTVFLSHKHGENNDDDEALGILELLQSEGVRVYIDSMDNKMPNETSGVTASRIKSIIKHSDKFILLATRKAIQSYWCNWELGIGDVHKYYKNISLIPVKERGEFDTQYAGNEYLQIYPRIEFEDGNNNYIMSRQKIPRGYYVYSPQYNKYGDRYRTNLKDWLYR